MEIDDEESTSSPIPELGNASPDPDPPVRQDAVDGAVEAPPRAGSETGRRANANFDANVEGRVDDAPRMAEDEGGGDDGGGEGGGAGGGGLGGEQRSGNANGITLSLRESEEDEYCDVTGNGL